MAILGALQRLVVDHEETESPAGDFLARGTMRFGAALRGPPGRVHGGHHAFARTLTILARLTAHAGAATFPCELDLSLQRSLPLEEDVPYEATYRRSSEGWELHSRLLGTDRLRASARSLSSGTLLDDEERARWKALHDESVPFAKPFRTFGIEVKDAPSAIWMDVHEPRVTAPESQHAALVDADGVFGPPFVCTQLDLLGAVARSRSADHPHFTKHIHLRLAAPTIPASARLVCLADRTTVEPDTDSETPPIEIDGVVWGTTRVRVALFDSDFGRAHATATITVHPIDPAKFPEIGKTETRRVRSVRS